MDWNSAKSTCEQDGAALLVPKSIEENNFFAFVEHSGLNVKIWLGINDIDTEGEFVDSKGNPITFQNWNVGEPNNFRDEDAVEILSHNGKWNDDSVNDQAIALCVFYP